MSELRFLASSFPSRSLLIQQMVLKRAGGDAGTTASALNLGNLAASQQSDPRSGPGGQPVAAAMPAPDANVSLQLRQFLPMAISASRP
jgi:hypothetical protein